jgi:carboxylesterase type B
MSGQQIKGASIEIASGRTKTVLEKMGVDSSLRGKELMVKLDALTMEQIQDGTRAVSPDRLPVVDNVILFRNPFDPDAPALSQMVPMMLGNVHDETAVAGPANMTWEQAPAALDRAVQSIWGRFRRRRLSRSSTRFIRTIRQYRWILLRQQPSGHGLGSAGRRSGGRRIRRASRGPGFIR